VARFLVVIAMGISIITFGEYIFQKFFLIDELIFADPGGVGGKFPLGRLAPITAVNFILFDLAIFLSTNSKKNYYQAAQIAIFMVFIISFQAFLGYFFSHSNRGLMASRETGAGRRVRKFLSIASHELRTPLTSLKLQLQMNHRMILKGEKSLAFQFERITKFIEMSEKQVDHLAKLVDDILDISRIDLGRLAFVFEKMDLGNLVKDVIDRFSDQFESAKCNVVQTIEEGIVGIWDRPRLEQVVFNLFERTILAGSISGLGLGLYICKQIIEAHNGSVQIESELGKGSLFKVELPLERK
jgi:signal transduction histidine kinase